MTWRGGEGNSDTCPCAHLCRAFSFLRHRSTAASLGTHSGRRSHERSLPGACRVPAGTRRPIPDACWVPAGACRHPPPDPGCLLGACRVPAGTRHPTPGACWMPAGACRHPAPDRGCLLGACRCLQAPGIRSRVPAGCLPGACRHPGTRFRVPASLQAPDLQAPDFVSRLEKYVRVPGCLPI